MKLDNILISGEEVICSLKSHKKARLLILKFILGISILTLAFVFYMMYALNNSLNHEKFNYVWAILIVLYITYIENSIKRKNERYYITNKRIIKIYNKKVEEMQICFLKDAKIINEHKDVGDIIFSNTLLDGFIKSSSSIFEEVLEKRINCEVIRFIGVKNPKEVLSKVLSIQSMYR